MKYLIVDDEHILYKRMFRDLFHTSKYNIEEVPRVAVPKVLKPLYDLHYNSRINSHFFLPGKMLWTPFYKLHKYPFKKDEQYAIVFLNGSLRFHYSKEYLKRLKVRDNIKLVMIMYDSYVNPAAKRAFDLVEVFDLVFSFDKKDCEKFGFEHFYSTFSSNQNVYRDDKLKNSAFFIGFASGRLKILQESFLRITSNVEGCKFYIAGVKDEEIIDIKDVIYNETMSYDEELQMAYNTGCIVEIVKEGQKGVSLRTCEAIAFNKKLLTNNKELENMPFYDKRFMRVFSSTDDIDTEFIKEPIDVTYDVNDFFSPLRIIGRIDKLLNPLAEEA